MHKKSNTFVYKFFVKLSAFLNNSVRVYPVMLKIGILYYTNNTLRNTVFLDICQYFFKNNCFYILPHHPGWIHPVKFISENEAYKISLRWKRFGFSTSPVCIGNLSHLKRNFKLLMFPSEFWKFWYCPGDIAQAVFGHWLTNVSFNIYTGYK